MNDLKIAGPDVNSVAISLDKHQIIYSIAVPGGGETRLRDLQTGEERVLVSTGSWCISWNEDNDMLNYHYDHELYVYSLSTGHSTLVATASSAEYNLTGFGSGNIVYGAINCGAWIGPDRFLFSRTVSMPSQIDSGTNIIPADTLTLAVIGETITLVDSNEIGLMGISDDGTQILIMQDGEQYLTPPFNDFESIIPHRIPVNLLSFHRWGFMPTGSDLYYVDDTLEGGNQIHFIDSKTWEDHLGPKLLADSYEWPDWIWVGDPKENLFAVVENRESGPFHVFLIDLDTGGRIEIVEGLLAEDLAISFDTSILDWLPP